MQRSQESVRSNRVRRLNVSELGGPHHVAVVDSAGNVSIQKACVAQTFYIPSGGFAQQGRGGVIYAAGPSPSPDLS
jgi:hypothetical protein